MLFYFMSYAILYYIVLYIIIYYISHVHTCMYIHACTYTSYTPCTYMHAHVHHARLSLKDVLTQSALLAGCFCLR